jgi:gamma-glutamyltranspeptidase/glutathione hydrolase
MSQLQSRRSWRDRSAAPFICEKRPTRAARGMVVSNHPLASAAGAEMLAAGGNAVDAAIATLFTLTIVEPMMVGMLGGGMAHLRMASGPHLVIDGQSTVPSAGRPDMYKPISDTLPDYLETAGRLNALGALSVAVPGNLGAWCETLARYGTFALADVMEPAIRHASRGFRVTHYLADCLADAAADMARDKAISAVFLPGGTPLKAGDRLVQGDAAETLRAVATEGPGLLRGGALGNQVAEAIAKAGGILTAADIAGNSSIDRQPVRGWFRGFEVFGPPPPSAGGPHIVQMLNILERHDVAAMGFGSTDAMHLLAEVLKIAFADRKAATADPAFVEVPVARLIDKAYAAERAAAIDMARAQTWRAGVALPESHNTTHLTAADHAGNIVATTQTINSLFGARIMIPGTGLIPNNYMHTFDPHPGFAGSIQPGKRVTSSMSPTIVLKDGKPHVALGLPGGLRIFGSVMQALVNLIEHGMDLQDAVEAPRIWTQSGVLEVEPAVPQAMREALAARGHTVQGSPTVGGGMSAIRFHDDGTLEGAACWRADGTPVGVGGGLARKGVRFQPDVR